MIFLLCLRHSFCFVWWRYIKHSRQCFIRYLNTLNFVINTLLRVAFSTLSSVFQIPMKKCLLFLIYYFTTEQSPMRNIYIISVIEMSKVKWARGLFYGVKKPISDSVSFAYGSKRVFCMKICSLRVLFQKSQTHFNIKCFARGFSSKQRHKK